MHSQKTLYFKSIRSDQSIGVISGKQQSDMDARVQLSTESNASQRISGEPGALASASKVSGTHCVGKEEKKEGQLEKCTWVKTTIVQ